MSHDLPESRDPQDPLDLARAALPGLTWSRVAPAALPPLAPPAVPMRTLRRAMLGRALSRAARPVILVNDADRPMPPTLPDVVRELWEVSGERAIILVATGTHLGETAFYRDRFGGLPVAVHDARDDATHVRVDVAGIGAGAGVGARIGAGVGAGAGASVGAGVGAVGLDRRVVEADLIVAFGSVEPHYFGGWSGAHKTATVGVMDHASIEDNHRGALDPASRVLALEGNPVFDGLAAVLRALEAGGRTVLCVNHVLDADDRPVSVAVGTWRGALERALPAARARFVRPLPAPVDVLVARVRGALSRTLYQAEKGLKNHEHVVRDGGDVIVEADLGHGVGPDRFVRLLEEAPTLEEALRRVEERYVLGDHKAVKLRALQARGVRVRLVSPRLAPEAVARAGLEVHGSLQAALATIRADLRPACGVGLIVEDAAVVTTRLEPGAGRASVDSPG